jgi:hypothetical protein
MNTSRLVKALLIGLLGLFIGAVLCELVTSPSEGHRIDFEKSPPAAQAIAKEQPGAPISPEQWKRLDKVMASEGGWPSGKDVFLRRVRASWYCFSLIPALGVGAFFARWKGIAVVEAAAIVSPCLLLLLFAFSSIAPILSR